MSSFVPASELVLQAIGERARSLSERLAYPGNPAPTPSPPVLSGLGAARAAAWAAALAPRCPDALEHRLAWDGLDPVTLSGVLAPERPSDPPPAAWLGTLREVLDAATTEPAAAADLEVSPPAVTAESSLPFAEVLRPFVRVASRRLSPAAAALRPTARARCEDHLLRRLATHAGQALHEHFTGFRDRLTPPGGTAGETGCALHELFTAHMRGGGLAAFFLEYSVLGRILVRLTECWAANLNRMLTRLAEDGGAIAERFGQDGAWGQIADVRPGLSDPHHGGEQVSILEFTSGRRLVYKPKDLGHEVAWHALLGHLRRGGLGEDTPAAATVLARPGYGWVEFVLPSGCGTPAELARYHRRAGAMLCLVHALGGDDCHRQNILATREGPVLVDAESLLRPVLDAWAAGSPQDARIQALALKSGRTVLHTGLLPVRPRGGGDPTAPPGPDVSGLRGAGGHPARSQRVAWKHPGTDRMELAWETPVSPETDNLPTLDGRRVLPEEHLEDLLAGFTAAYRVLLDECDALAADPDGPLGGMVSGHSRLIFRPTQIYARLLHGLLAPKSLRTGIERSLSFEALARAFVTAGTRPFFWPLLALERRSLEAGDFPLFTAAGVARALGLEPASFCAQPGALLADLSAADLAYQCDLIRGTFRESLDWAPAVTTAASPALSRDELIDEAARLADALVALADPRNGQSFCADTPPWHLYGGDLGVALFLAGIERVAPGRGHRAHVHAVCERVERALAAAAEKPEDGAGAALGAGNGWGGTIYGLTAVAGLLGDARYTALAVRSAPRLITPTRIAADRFHDAIGGAAGAIYGLLALHRASGDPAALDLAAAAGRHLVASRRPGPRGGHGWPVPTPAAPMLAGFPHGAGGIAAALRRLAARVPDAGFLEAAGDALAYERTVFVPERRDWPYLHAPLDGPGRETAGGGRAPVYFKTWCHGAPSVALARLGCLGGPDDAEVLADLETALDSAANVGLPLPELDHLCCGNFGRLGILDLAGRRLARPALRERALAWATLAVRRAAREGGYRLDAAPGTSSTRPAAGLFRGLAGIGYGLLQLAEPEALPELLLWG